MKKEIIFSSKEYQIKYYDLLESYLLNGYEDLEEIDFIKSEILLYKKYTNISYGFQQRNFMNGRNLNESFEINLNEIDTQIRNKLYDIGNKFSEEICNNIILSFEKIIQFLELQKANPINSNSKTSLTIGEIALKCFYEGTIITRENAKNYLIGTGHTSGDKLYQEFSKWSNRTDRKSNPESKLKLNNKIKSFEKVIAELPENKKETAKDELKILYSFKSKYE